MTLSNQEIKSICQGNIYDPHHLLGIHTLGDEEGVVVRGWDPPAQKLTLTRLDTSESYPMESIESSGLFELVLPDTAEPFKYSFHSEYKGGLATGLILILSCPRYKITTLLLLMKVGTEGLSKNWEQSQGFRIRPMELAL